MTPHEYQQFALSTYCAPDHVDRTDYLHHLLIKEVGKVMSLFAKSMRDGHAVDRDRLVSELGDALWCVACLEGWSFWYHPPYYSAHEPMVSVVGDLMRDPDIVCLLSLIGYCSLRSGHALTLEEIAIANVQKLTSRRDRGVLKGSGDDR